MKPSIHESVGSFFSATIIGFCHTFGTQADLPHALQWRHIERDLNRVTGFAYCTSNRSCAHVAGNWGKLSESVSMQQFSHERLFNYGMSCFTKVPAAGNQT